MASLVQEKGPCHQEIDATTGCSTKTYNLRSNRVPRKGFEDFWCFKTGASSTTGSTTSSLLSTLSNSRPSRLSSRSQRNPLRTTGKETEAQCQLPRTTTLKASDPNSGMPISPGNHNYFSTQSLTRMAFLTNAAAAGNHEPHPEPQPAAVAAAGFRAAAHPAPPANCLGQSVPAEISSYEAAESATLQAREASLRQSDNGSTAAHTSKVCHKCGVTKSAGGTWRAGPAGPHTLCNRCGLRFSRRRPAALQTVQVDGEPTSAFKEVPAGLVPLHDEPMEEDDSNTAQHLGDSSGRSHLQPVGSRDHHGMHDAAKPFLSDDHASKQPSSSTTAHASRVVTTSTGSRRSCRLAAKAQAQLARVPAKTGHHGSDAQCCHKESDSRLQYGTWQGQSKAKKRVRQVEHSAGNLQLDCNEEVREPAFKKPAIRQSYKPPTATHHMAAAINTRGAHGMMRVSSTYDDKHAEAVQLIASVAPGGGNSLPAGRSSRRLAQRRSKSQTCDNHCVEDIQVADEVTAAAEALLQMAGCCWVEGLAGILHGELDDLGYDHMEQ